MGEQRKRSQVVTPRKRRNRSSSSRRSGGNIRVQIVPGPTLVKIGGALALVLFSFLCYRWLTGSELFVLHRVRVSGASTALSAEIEQTVRGFAGQTSVAELNLSALKEKVEKTISRVQTVWVRRVLPDELRIEVAERQPAVLVRRENGNLMWLDAEGVELGDTYSVKPSASGPLPPVARGFSEAAPTPGAVADNRERIAIYRQIQKEFSQEPGSVLNMVDEIDLTYTKDVNLRIARTAVMVHVGSRDFRNRFETGIAVLEAARRGDEEMLRRYKVPDAATVTKNGERINYIEAARSDRVVLSFSSAGADKKDKDKQETRKK